MNKRNKHNTQTFYWVFVVEQPVLYSVSSHP